MIDWIRELANELMPETEPKPDLEEEQARRRARHSTLEWAQFELMLEGVSDPSPRHIWERAGY